MYDEQCDNCPADATVKDALQRLVAFVLGDGKEGSERDETGAAGA